MDEDVQGENERGREAITSLSAPWNMYIRALGRA